MFSFSVFPMCIHAGTNVFLKKFLKIGSFNVSVFFFSHELNIYFYDTFSSWNIQSCTIGNPVWSQVNYFCFFFFVSRCEVRAVFIKSLKISITIYFRTCVYDMMKDFPLRSPSLHRL